MDGIGSQIRATRPPPFASAEPRTGRHGFSGTAALPQQCLPRDTRQKRYLPPGLDASSYVAKPAARSFARAASKTTPRANVTAPKPLVPVTERRSHEDKDRSWSKGDSDSGRWDIAPDGASAGREGRQFTVANVGNNGRIYLRPTVRPAHQRCPQPSFAFPLTPPSTGGIEALGPETNGRKGPAENHVSSQLKTSQWTPTPATSLLAGDTRFAPEPWNPGGRTRPRRAMSDSTMNDSGVANDRDRDAFKVVISKPDADKRPRTMEDIDLASTPLLSINIPSWRIGTPRFTLKGTPVLRGSSYAPTEEFPSSSVAGYDRLSASHSVLASDFRARKPPSLAIRPLPGGPMAQRGAGSLPSPRLLRSPYLSTHSAIEPAMFTDLTFKPACDDRCLVRYSPAGAVTAATPPRLVAEITSPSFLDYELISDFFLTFRSFLAPTDLLRMLVARLRWALLRNDEVGMIVRVRTFVAVRHWILNYFLDDFVPEFDLRLEFCELLNQFVDEVSQDASCVKVRLKILAELKKCWRRVCAEHWDGPEFDDSLGPQVPITPGGLIGNRNQGLDLECYQEYGLINHARLDSWAYVPPTSTESASFYPDALGFAPAEDLNISGLRPATPLDRVVGRRAGAESAGGSPLSSASLDIVSCSFPSRLARACIPDGVPSKQHAPPVSLSNPTAKPLAGRKSRPTHTHKRNNSTSDSLREHGAEKPIGHDYHSSAPWPSAGSLVRGDLLPPGQPFVTYEPPEMNGGRNRQTTIFHPSGRSPAKERAVGSAMSSRGMKKLLGSVRRVLRSRGHVMSPWQAQLMGVSPAGSVSSTTTRLPGTAVVPQNLARQAGERPPVRIDLLGAEVAEDFKTAIREEEAAAEADALGLGVPPNSAPPFGGPTDYSAAYMQSSTFDSLPQNHHKPRAMSDTGVTVGSKSIVIVDDTLPFEGAPALTRGPLARNPSGGGAFARALIPSQADPTPPDTPPTNSMPDEETPRQTFYDANRSTMMEQSAAACDSSLPLNHLHLSTAAPPANSDGGNASADASGASPPRAMRRMRRPPMSGGTFRMRRDHHRSAGTIQSLDSVIHGRCLSFSNSSAVPSTSADSYGAAADDALAPTLDEEEDDAPEPAPLRVLRRRPGGDLRAATNVGELDRDPLRRSPSVGTLAMNTTSSAQSSYFLSRRPKSAGRSESPASLAQSGGGRRQPFSVGQLAERAFPLKTQTPDTDPPNKPPVRPSFEREAHFLAQIPDDEDDGGIESALLKLEGKFPRRAATPAMGSPAQAALNDADGSLQPLTPDEPGSASRKRGRNENRHVHVLDDAFPIREEDVDKEQPSSSPQEHDFASGQDLLQRAVDARPLPSEAFYDSYCSIPLLQRDVANERPDDAETWEWTDRSILRSSLGDESRVADDDAPPDATTVSICRASSDLVPRTATWEGDNNDTTGESAPPEIETRSFLDDDTNDTDLSSELSTDFAIACTTEHDEKPALEHRHASPVAAHPSTMFHATDTMMSGAVNIPSPRTTGGPGQMLPTPDMSPAAPHYQASAFAGPIEDALEAPKPKSGNAPPLRKYNVHLPFILAYESDTLAQQLTLIEMDALNDIDWKELVDMKWKHATRSDPRSWVDFLRHSDAQGVEVVIARFNIMVKWAVSEIVLTQQVEERARCIIKLIHMASHCRRYRNFATLAQLTMALSSNEVTRLAETWALVPPHDVQTLASLEGLITPTRNFHALRAEMEVGSDAGCIPFVGIYTHDLLYNAQRPSEIASSPHSAPLINFERCRIGAAVVKTLLRLLEASTRYTFSPMEGVIERCLWIGALSDDEIRRRADGLE